MFPDCVALRRIQCMTILLTVVSREIGIQPLYTNIHSYRYIDISIYIYICFPYSLLGPSKLRLMDAFGRQRLPPLHVYLPPFGIP